MDGDKSSALLPIVLGSFKVSTVILKFDETKKNFSKKHKP
jgi:hypothetical protein